jgi:hypothetical protein
MNHSNMYAVGLALCTFANIASEEMSRDLCNEVEKLLGSSNTYIRKKVGLALKSSPIPFSCSTGGSLCIACCQKSSRAAGSFHRESKGVDE